MIIRNLNTMRIAVDPGEADAVLVIDPNCVLSVALRSQRVEPQSGSRPHVVQRSGSRQKSQAAPGKLL